MKYFSFILFNFALTLHGYSQEYKNFVQGKFIYCNQETNAVITFKGSKMIEEYKLGNQPTIKIISKVKWLSEKSYQVTAVKIQGGPTEFKPGDSFIVKIFKIEGNKMLFSYEFNDGFSDNECFIKE